MQNYLDGRTVLKTETSPVNSLQTSDEFQPLFFPSQKNESGGNGAQGAKGVHETPQIEVISQDGVIQKIIVTCTCCKRIELECQY